MKIKVIFVEQIEREIERELEVNIELLEDYKKANPELIDLDAQLESFVARYWDTDDAEKALKCLDSNILEESMQDYQFDDVEVLE